LAAQYGGGGSCGTSPTCSTACSNSASSGGSGSSGGGTTNTNAQINQLAESIGDLLGQWAAAREAKHEREAQELQQKAEQEAAQMEAESNAEDQRARERAAFLADPSSVNQGANQAPSDPNVNLRNQLSAGGDTATTQPQQIASADPSDQMAQLRAQMTAQAAQEDQPSSSAVDTAGGVSAGTSPPSASSPDPSITEPVPGYISPLSQQSIQAAMIPPSASPLSSAFQQSNDDSSATTPTVAGSVMDSIKAIPGQINDGLDNLMSQVSSVKTSLTNLWNDPSVQMMNSIRTGNYTTAPLPAQGDTPDEALNKTFAQSILGFGDFKDGFPKGLYNYGTKMVDQMGAYLGLANSQISSGDDPQ